LAKEVREKEEEERPSWIGRGKNWGAAISVLQEGRFGTAPLTRKKKEKRRGGTWKETDAKQTARGSETGKEARFLAFATEPASARGRKQQKEVKNGGIQVRKEASTTRPKETETSRKKDRW